MKRVNKLMLAVTTFGLLFSCYITYLSFQNGYEASWHLLIGPMLGVLSVLSSFIPRERLDAVS